MIKITTPIRSVKVSKPRLSSQNSHRSSTASHEYSSDYASDVSSEVSRLNYDTPPSRVSTPQVHQHNNNDTEMTLPRRPNPAALPPLSTRYVSSRSTDQPVRPLDRLDNTTPPTPGHDDTPYIQFALEQITLDEEVQGPWRVSRLNEHDGNVRSIQQGHPRSNESNGPRRNSEQPNRPPSQPPHLPPTNNAEHRELNKAYTLIPIDPPVGDPWRSLRYVPTPLRFSTLSALILLCLFMIAGILASNIYTIRHAGLYDYDGNDTRRYFIFQYLPQLIGFVVILWLSVVQAAIYRSLPYFCMSAELDCESMMARMPILSANFVLPDLRFFKLREPIIGAVMVIFWLMNFTIPLLACSYQTQYFFEGEQPTWKWSTVQGLGWFLVAWYILLILALICCMIRFRAKNSALMWDPCSIADTIMLFQRSNILLDYARSEVEPDLEAFLPDRELRLGFWTPSNTHDVFHTVGQAGLASSRLSFEGEQVKRAVVAQYKIDSVDSFDFERHRYSGGSDFTRNIHSPYLRYRWCPWFLSDSAILAWIIAAMLLLIAFLVVSFVNRAVQNGFDPLLPSTTAPNGFSPSNFLYSFLPTLLGTWMFLVWQPVDVYFRSVQPYANLASPNGTTANRSLLQSYPAMPTILVTYKALINQDFKLAYITFVSLLSITIPILAGGVFTAQLFSDGDVRMVASMPGYLAMCVFIAIYALSFLIIWPTRKRYLPHSIDTLAGQLSFLYASPLLNEPAISGARTKADLTSRLSGDGHLAPNEIDEKGLTGDGRRRLRERRNALVDREPKYAFGIFIGRDGKEHLGVDRLQRPGSGEMLVTTGHIRPSRSLRSTRT